MSEDATTPLAFLRRIGIDRVRHNSNEDLLPHLLRTRDLLQGWRARPTLCDAGLCHSVYGTEYFGTALLPPDRRDEVRAVIGAEAERLVWLWCFARRTSLPRDLPRGARSRIEELRTDQWIELAAQQHDDLVDLWIADTLEQLPRMPQREVPTARALMDYRHRALPAARAALEDVLSRHAPGAPRAPGRRPIPPGRRDGVV